MDAAPYPGLFRWERQFLRRARRHVTPGGPPAPSSSSEPAPSDQPGVFLSTLPAGPAERRLALTVVLVSAVVFLATVPFAKTRLAPVWAFIPIYEAALVVNDLITAVLLFGQFAILRSRALLVLASGYLFTAFITVAHALTFPGLFSPTGLLGAGPQSTAWLYMFWHGLFPLFVIAYAVLKGRERATGARRDAVAILASVGAMLLLAAALSWLATAGQEALPAIMQGNQYTPAMRVVVSTVWGASALALVILWRCRPHSVLDVWLMAVLCVWMCDIALAAVLNGGRFDLGFYAGRIYGWLAASFVLVVLLLENGKLYARLVAAHARERDERRRGQRAEELALTANRAKSEFLSRMSHELRTPLNGIIGFAQLLEMDRLTEDQRESVAHILKGGRHLLGLINEVLDIARIEAGKPTISLESVAAGDVVRGAVDLVRPQAAARAVRLTAETDHDHHVMADRQRLQQVLLNLLSNAVKYNRDGGSVTVAVRPDRVAGRLAITVADTGRGISPAMRQRLYTPFDRLGAEQSSVEGTGLGLALSKRLVEAMGGTLAFESQVGEGTTFTVHVPMTEPPVATLIASSKPAPDDAGAAAQGTVLSIEDNVANVRLLERIVGRRPGLRLLSAMQGNRGVELARDHRPGLILLDLHLPDMHGGEVLARLQADPVTREIPVVILSADATPGQITQLLDEGARAYLTKPVDVTEVLGLIDEVFDGQRRLPA
jgi:signal transduction histidine kinase/ActR/RegA family two-component response regulator